MTKRAVMLGNEAIARGIVEAGCEVAVAYPGTPSSEILPSIAAWADELGTNTQVEWGANEKVAYEMAFGAAMTGKRTCAVMKQVGLNAAADAFMSSALFKLKGGMLLVVADDPGPHSSQTEQDSRYFAMYAKIPCFDPSSPQEAKDMVFDAYDVSERFNIVTMLRPTGKINHAKQDVELKDTVIPPNMDAKFEKEPSRWISLPGAVKVNHPRVNAVNKEIAKTFETEYGKYNYEVKAKEKATLGVIAGGSTFAFLKDILVSLGRNDVDILKIGTPVPLPVKMCQDFIDSHDKVLVLEQPYPVIEMQIPNKTNVMGRLDDTVPSSGELLPELIENILHRVLGEPERHMADPDIAAAMAAMQVKPRPPMLCAGCPHRSSFFSIRQALPNAINPSDIGCYTLGVNQRGVDTVIDMGGAVTIASGLHLAHKASGESRPIVSTIGDSTFYHNGMPGLASAVYNKHAFVLCILDNRITAMTGGQSSPSVGEKLRKGDSGVQLSIEESCKGCGVKYIKAVDAYDTQGNKEVIKEAWEYAKANEEPAVVIMRYPCITMLKLMPEQKPVAVNQDKCIGCKVCINLFNCPGLVFDEAAKKAHVDERYCVKCGVCQSVCPHGAIEFINN